MRAAAKHDAVIPAPRSLWQALAVRATELRFGAWELAAALVVAVIAGALVGAAVERVTFHAASASTTTTTTVAPRPRQPRAVARSASSPAEAWIDAAALRRRVADTASRDRSAVGVAVRPLGGGPLVLAGDVTTGAAWSTIKVPIVLARYRLAEARHESQALIAPLAARALTESDNAAAAELFGEIETAQGGLAAASTYVGEELRDAGDNATSINTLQPDFGPFSTYGQTEWSLGAGTLFYRQLARGCVPPGGAVAQVLSLMAQVVPSQRWGIGAGTWPGSGRLRFKGGWGPDRSGRYLVRQFGIVESADGRRGFVVGLIAAPADGTFETGVKVIDDLAAAVAASTETTSAPVFASC
jgi:hypothetical protein